MLHQSSRPLDPAGPIVSVGFVGSLGRCCFSDLLLRTCPTLDTAFSSASRAALLSKLTAGELDAAIYPGPPASDIAGALLCLDHVVVAMRAGHYLSHNTPIAADVLRERAVLLPSNGREGDFRRLVQAALPGLTRVTERPMREIAGTLQATDAVALVAAGQVDEIGGDTATARIADADTGFPIQLAWNPRLEDGAFGRLLAALHV